MTYATQTNYEVRWLKPKTAKTSFAGFRRGEVENLHRYIQDLQNWICEHSANANSIVWTTATEKHAVWGRSDGRSGAHKNTMLSVLAGANDKLLRGADLTEKQLEHVTNAISVAHELDNHWPQVTFNIVESFSKTGNAVQDLQNSLFE